MEENLTGIPKLSYDKFSGMIRGPRKFQCGIIMSGDEVITQDPFWICSTINFALIQGAIKDMIHKWR